MNNNKCKHHFNYPFIACTKCGGQLLVGDYTVAQITGDWSVKSSVKSTDNIVDKFDT